MKIKLRQRIKCSWFDSHEWEKTDEKSGIWIIYKCKHCNRTTTDPNARSFNTAAG